MHRELRLPGRPDVYLGQAAHCSGTGGQTETDGCTSGSLPLGTPVEVTGASKPGTLAYNSWLTMQANGRDRPRHLRLQRPRPDQDRPGRRRQGQPLGARASAGRPGSAPCGDLGSTVYSYGNSALRAGVTKLSPKQGIVVQNEGGGWSHVVVTLTPGIPGDSGQRLPQRLRRGDRRAQHAADRAAGRHQRRRRPRPRSSPTCAPTPASETAAGAGHRALQTEPAWERSSAPERRRVQLGEQVGEVEGVR